MRLVGFDFETANPCSGSICAVGLAVVEDGRVVERFGSLVRPHPDVDWMDWRCQRVHGIAEEELAHAPEFPEVWKTMRELLSAERAVGVAHNAPFDTRQIRAALRLYGFLEPLEFPYVCSCRVSRRLLPDLENHRLDTVCSHFGIVFRHHDALEDAEACAKIIARLGIPDGMVQRFAP